MNKYVMVKDKKQDTIRILEERIADTNEMIKERGSSLIDPLQCVMVNQTAIMKHLLQVGKDCE